MRLTTHGNLIATSDPDLGVAVILCPDGGMTDIDWVEAITAHELSADYLDWSYAESAGWTSWLLVAEPVRVVA